MTSAKVRDRGLISVSILMQQSKQIVRQAAKVFNKLSA